MTCRIFLWFVGWECWQSLQIPARVAKIWIEPLLHRYLLLTAPLIACNRAEICKTEELILLMHPTHPTAQFMYEQDSPSL